MPGFTQNKGYIYPVQGDRSHTGLSPDVPGSFDLFQEQVDGDMVLVDEALADLADRVTQVERGWQPIVDGSVASGATTIAIDLTNGGDFPAGTFSRIKLTIIGEFDAAGYVGVQLNGNSSSIYRRHYLARTYADVFLDDDSFTGSAWLVGRWSDAEANNLVMELFGTDVSGLIGYQVQAHQQHTSSIGSYTIGGGRLESSLLPNSMTVFPTNGATEFGDSGARWWVEGYVA